VVQIPRGFLRLIQPSGAVLIPATIARAILGATTIGLEEMRRRNELGRLSDDAIEALQALYVVAQDTGTSASGPASRESANVEASPQGGSQRMLTSGEAARIYGCDERHIRRLCRSGRLPAVRVGRQWTIRPEDLDEFRFSRRKGAA
jgi:excisionase family DNA binding protein